MQSEMTFDLLSIDSKHLFEELCTERKLVQGWREVRKNRGTSGSDGQTIEAFELRLSEEIKQLQAELVHWTYTPQPVRRVEIPKPDGAGVRLLGVPYRIQVLWNESTRMGGLSKQKVCGFVQTKDVNTGLNLRNGYA